MAGKLKGKLYHPGRKDAGTEYQEQSQRETTGEGFPELIESRLGIVPSEGYPALHLGAQVANARRGIAVIIHSTLLGLEPSRGQVQKCQLGTCGICPLHYMDQTRAQPGPTSEKIEHFGEAWGSHQPVGQ